MKYNFICLESDSRGGLYLSQIEAKDLEQAYEIADESSYNTGNCLVINETDAVGLRDWLNKLKLGSR